MKNPGSMPMRHPIPLLEDADPIPLGTDEVGEEDESTESLEFEQSNDEAYQNALRFSEGCNRNQRDRHLQKGWNHVSMG
jgi:hypothetical protein